MDEQVARLVDKAWALHQAQPPDQRLLIAIAGMPGSGKTSLAARVAAALNARAAAPPAAPLAAPVPMDGFHLTRAQLDAAPDPAAAHARRGAPHTFDPRAYLGLVRALRAPVRPGAPPVLAPTFDHAVKDPVPDGLRIGPAARVVLLEGNYVGMEDEPGAGPDALGPGTRAERRARAADPALQIAEPDACWAVARALVDEVWFVHVEHAVARRRLAARHVAAGIVGTLEEGERRADENDVPNGVVIERRRGDVDELLESREDASWAPAA